MRRLLLLLVAFFFSASVAWAVAGPSSSKSYDGNGDEVDWGNINDVTTNDVSYCMWINPTDDNSEDWWFGKSTNTSTPNAGYSLGSYVTGDTSGCEVSDGTGLQSAFGASDIDGKWTFVCCVWDSTNDDLTTYENAVSVGSDTADTIGSLSNAVSLQNGENAGDVDDALGLAAYASIFLSKQLTVMEMTELMWKPEGIASSISFVASILATGTEKDWVGNVSATVSGTVTPSTNGAPPVMFGLGLPL